MKILAQLCSGDSLREHGSCWTEVASFYGVGNHTDRVVSAHIITARQNTATQQRSCAKVMAQAIRSTEGGQWLSA